MAFFLFGAVIATVLGVLALKMAWPLKKPPNEGWNDYFWRVYMTPGTLVFAAYVGWAEGLDFSNVTSQTGYLALLLWAVLLFFIGRRLHQRAVLQG